MPDLLTESPESIVTSLYRLLLWREPGSHEVSHYAEALRTHRFTPQQLAREFALSNEFMGLGSEPARTVRVAAMGCIFLLPEGFAVIDELQAASGYEPWVLPYFLECCRPGMTVLDIGASIGAFALPAAKRVTSKGRVYAFEAGPVNCRLLARSAKASGLANLHLLAFGASDALGVDFMRRQGFTSNNVMAGAHRVDVDNLDAYDVVPVQPIDLLRPALGAVHVIKMDIEGMEYKATLGAMALIRESRPVVFCEYSPQFQKHGSAVDGRELLGTYLDLGYQVEILHRNKPREAVLPGDTSAAVEHVTRAWEHHVREDSGTHLDLCFRPVVSGQPSGNAPSRRGFLSRQAGRNGR